MATVRDLMQVIEAVAPLKLQEEYDNAGLQCGDPAAQVQRVLCCLDVTEAVVNAAIEQHCQFIVSHHPLLFMPVKSVTSVGNYISRCLYLAISHGIAIYAAHTNLDNAPEGVNQMIADCLGLQQQQILAPIPAERLIGLEADFATRCGSGRVGILPHSLSREEFVQLVKERLHVDAIRINIDSPETLPSIISKVALCGGAGSDFIADAERVGADAYLTGEVGYHRMFGHSDLLLVEAGHYETEHQVVYLFKQMLEPLGVECEVFLPQ